MFSLLNHNENLGATVTFNFMVERPDGPLRAAVYHERLLRFIFCSRPGLIPLSKINVVGLHLASILLFLVRTFKAHMFSSMDLETHFEISLLYQI